MGLCGRLLAGEMPVSLLLHLSLFLSLWQNGTLKTALLDYIKRCRPGDSEKHNMIALCFSMCREIGENHEAAANVQLKLIESQPWGKGSPVQVGPSGGHSGWMEAALGDPSGWSLLLLVLHLASPEGARNTGGPSSAFSFLQALRKGENMPDGQHRPPQGYQEPVAPQTLSLSLVAPECCRTQPPGRRSVMRVPQVPLQAGASRGVSCAGLQSPLEAGLQRKLLLGCCWEGQRASSSNCNTIAQSKNCEHYCSLDPGIL